MGEFLWTLGEFLWTFLSMRIPLLGEFRGHFVGEFLRIFLVNFRIHFYNSNDKSDTLKQ